MKRKIKRYDEGGVTQEDLDAANASDDSIATLNARKGWTGASEEAPKAAKAPSFKEAFASARASGDKTFSWNGKKFTTELASSKPASKPVAPATEGAPKAKSSYEAPYDRMTRQNREQGIDFDSLVGKLKDRITGAAARTEDRYKNPATNYKKGGTVKKTASSRGDGIASRGKTKGRIV